MNRSVDLEVSEAHGASFNSLNKVQKQQKRTYIVVQVKEV